MSEAPFSPTIALLAMSRVWEAALAEALKPLGVTTRKYGLLGHIRRTPDISFSELARRSRITVQSAHAAVSSLVEAGLVDDGTAHAGAASRLRVTTEGESLLARAATELARLDSAFTTQHPALAQALHEDVTRWVAGSTSSFS